MSRVCESKLLQDYGIDGHAICYHWDFCRGRFDDSETCQCENPKNRVYKAIDHYITHSMRGPRPTLAEIVEND